MQCVQKKAGARSRQGKTDLHPCCWLCLLPLSMYESTAHQMQVFSHLNNALCPLIFSQCPSLWIAVMVSQLTDVAAVVVVVMVLLLLVLLFVLPRADAL